MAHANADITRVFGLQDGATALFKAAHKGHEEVVRALLVHRPKLGLLKVNRVLCCVM